MSIVRKINNQANFSLTPRTLDEAMQYAKLICESDFCPKEHRGKPGNVLIAVQYGAELGLSTMQALQNISIINGRPCIWGDAMLGLVLAHPLCENINEEIKNGTGYCSVKRKNQDLITRSFSIEDAKKAGLWTKPGPWQQYPNRMLQLRARGFALRDSFADVLKGLNMREEVEDYDVKPSKSKPVIPVRVKEIKSEAIAKQIEKQEAVTDATDAIDATEQVDMDQLNLDFPTWKFRIEAAPTLDDLKEVYEELKASNMKKAPELYKELIKHVEDFRLKIIKNTGEVS